MQTYDTYVLILYVICAIILAIIAGVAFLAWSLRKSEQSKWLKTLGKVLQVASDVVFGIFYMTVLGE